MSDYSTHEIVVRVAIRVSAYDKEHAVHVADGLLSLTDGVIFVTDDKQQERSVSNTGIIAQTKQAAFIDGVCYALEEIRSVYGDGVKNTDIWAEHMTKENN